MKQPFELSSPVGQCLLGSILYVGIVPDVDMCMLVCLDVSYQVDSLEPTGETASGRRLTACLLLASTIASYTDKTSGFMTP